MIRPYCSPAPRAVETGPRWGVTRWAKWHVRLLLMVGSMRVGRWRLVDRRQRKLDAMMRGITTGRKDLDRETLRLVELSMRLGEGLEK